MRRKGELWPTIACFSALRSAARRAARGHRDDRSAACFLERLEPSCLYLERELQNGTWRPGATASFVIHDPKQRTITVSPFRDRVIHHALMRTLEPVFERRMIHDTYACRRRKGTHAALARARVFCQRYPYFLKLDVQGFFRSLEHEVVLETLRRTIKDRRVLLLCATILAGPDGKDRKGLAIGSLSSQWFANMVLDRVDHLVKEQLRVPGYVRFMDDMILFARERAVLRDAHQKIQRYLESCLHLHLKERVTRLGPVSDGVPFLGWRLFPGVVRVAPANLRRYRWRLRQRRWLLARGRIDEERFHQSVRSVLAHLGHAQTLGLRRRWSFEVASTRRNRQDSRHPP